MKQLWKVINMEEERRDGLEKTEYQTGVWE